MRTGIVQLEADHPGFKDAAYRKRRDEIALAAYEHQLSDHFSITPNVIVTSYGRDDEGVRPTTDVYLRLTFFLNLE